MTNTSNNEPLLGADDKVLSELVSKVAYRKIEALSDLYKLVKSAVYGYALSFLKSHSDAKIVLHSTFLSIWVSAYMFTGQGKAMPWIMMIAKNHCFKIMRNRKWYGNLYSSEETADKTNLFILSIEENAISDTFLNSLDDEEREVIALSSIVGFSTLGIADFLNLPLLKVVALKHRAFAKLKKSAKENPNLNGVAVKTAFLKDSIKSAVAKTTCENWNNIAFDLANGRGEVVGMSDKKPKSRIAGVIRTLLALFVVLSLVLFGVLNYNRADLKPVSTLYFESGAQFELSLNTYNVVLEATAKNPEGEKVLKELSLNNAKLENALNSILKSLIKNGYLTEKSNALLIKAENASVSKASNLQNAAALHLKGALKEQKLITNIVLIRNDAEDDVNDAISKAKEYKISQPMADFINFIINSGVNKSFKELSTQSRTELVGLLKGVKEFESFKYENDPDGKAVYVSNDPKEIPKAENPLDIIIGPAEAMKKALEHAKLSSAQVYDITAKFNNSTPKIYYYDVVFTYKELKYVYEIDAISGDVIKNKTEPKG
ncbi:MAG: sigma-70 family RNA polymerase sigma factor [Clostridia bacterium]|nr:sigma-70 family RNA polymerase sigma factor [Clostridia bacterium]